MAASDLNSELLSIIEEWKQNLNRGVENVPMIIRMCEIFEKKTEAYYKMDPDPMDDRHPGRASPSCALGILMKALFRQEELMSKLVGDYIMSGRPGDQSPLHTVCCRLLLVLLPGVETSVVFQETDGLADRLLFWAREAEEPLCSYATGLLAGAMEIQDVAHSHRESNILMVPVKLRCLQHLAVMQEKDDGVGRMCTGHPQAQLSAGQSSVSAQLATSHSKLTDMTKSMVDIGCTISGQLDGSPPDDNDEQPSANQPSCVSADDRSAKGFSGMKRSVSPACSDGNVAKRSKLHGNSHCGGPDGEVSNSSWAEMEPYVIGTYSLQHPLDSGMKARLVLQYLATMADYQELLSCVMEGRAMDIIFCYIDLTRNCDVRLAFEALKYLAALLCHKKFTIDFLQRDGVQRLLRVCRPSVAATGVALCFYYLSYFEVAMERVCLLPEYVLSDVVGYMLWLMECSHDSSRCHSCMFFSQVFPYRIMLDLFDKHDGLRRLINTVSTLEILNVDTVSSSNVSDDRTFAMRQATRHVCGALKKYFETHLIVKAEEVHRSHVRSDGSSPLQEVPIYKPMKVTSVVVRENIDFLMDLLPVRSQWPPEHMFHTLGGGILLLQLLAISPSWNNFPGKPDTIRSALDVLHVLTVTTKTQIMMLSSVKVEPTVVTPAFSILIGLADGERFSDADVQRGALNVLINCVCGPSERLGGGVGRFMGVTSKRKVNTRAGEDVLSRLWQRVQTNNGIMTLLKLLSVKTPITEADSVRALACRALVGLSRSETVKQILSKLPIFSNGRLKDLMKEPVLQEKYSEHARFCQCASQLLERVSGNNHTNIIDASLDDIRRADIVAQTKILYQERELVQLIHRHLVCKGYAESAAVLQKEAGLQSCSSPPHIHPETPQLFTAASQLKGGPTHRDVASARHASQQTPIPNTSSPVILLTSVCSTDVSLSTSMTSTAITPYQVSPSHINQTLITSSPVTPSPGPLSFVVHRNSHRHRMGLSGLQKMDYSRNRFMREGGGLHRSHPPCTSSGMTCRRTEINVSLDGIVTEYLRKQHAQCRNPVTTCPPMSLFVRHHCPEPLGRLTAPISVTPRLLNRQILPCFGGPDGAKLDRRLFYSRFLPWQTYRDKEDESFSSCCFTDDEAYLMLGTMSGDIRLIDLATWDEVASLQCHSAPIVKIEPGHGGQLLLTSSWGVSQESALWAYGETLHLHHRFDDHFVEFSKLTQDRIVGTNAETANIYDVATGVKLATLYDVEKANNYKANLATFSPTDNHVLNDGVLWDVRTPRPLHKFDKFNEYISGAFHPYGLEIIINSEIWDLRTYKLLHTVPALDQCQIKFNHRGDVMFAIRVDDEVDIDEAHWAQYSSTLRTFDATDYAGIGTLDLKTRSIFDLCTDREDTAMAVVEQNASFVENSSNESLLRLYYMQRVRDDEDTEQREDEEEAEGGGGEDDEDDDDPSFLDFASSGNEDEDGGVDHNGNDGDDEHDEEEEEEDEEHVLLDYSPSNSDDDFMNDAEEFDDDDLLFDLAV